MPDPLTRHLDAVFGYLALRLHPDREAARDLCQEVFQAALVQRDRLRTPAAGRAWLLGIARNRVADHFRRRGRPALALDESTLVAAGDEDGSGRAARVARVLSSLPARQAALLEQRYLEGASLRAIAADQGTSEKAVESALARAREAFRRSYAELDARQETA